MSRVLKYKMHDQSGKRTNNQCQSLSNKESLDMEPIIMVVINHIFSTFENKMGIMTEPYDS
jgi:hypothetical protein